jgi:ATP-binding cassette subfamily B protein
VITGLRALMEGRTTILMTHTLDLAADADVVVLLKEGRVVAHGPPAEVLARLDRRFGDPVLAERSA